VYSYPRLWRGRRASSDASHRLTVTATAVMVSLETAMTVALVAAAVTAAATHLVCCSRGGGLRLAAAAAQCIAVMRDNSTNPGRHC
jgi:hypothetical protein